MNREELIQGIADIIQKEPKITDDEILDIVREARNKALLHNVPEYQPIEVQDKEKISTEYDERRKKVERKQYKDESTEEFD